jgi:hypothetical protein
MGEDEHGSLRIGRCRTVTETMARETLNRRLT